MNLKRQSLKGLQYGKLGLLALMLGMGTQAAWAALTYDGATSMGLEVITPAAKVFQEKTGIKFDHININGSEKAVSMLVEGKADIVCVGRSLTFEEKKQKLFYQIIGYDTVVIFVNSKNPINSLTRTQLKKIFLGQTTNWQEVGGAKGPINIWLDTNPGRVTLSKTFKKSIMDEQSFANAASSVASHEGVMSHLQKVAEDPNAVSFDSAAMKIPGVKTIAIDGVDPAPENVRSGAYLITRPMHLVTKGIPRGEAKKFMDFMLSPEGQEIVKKSFVPLR
jgi:phosphate transport system substrate-binding protein